MSCWSVGECTSTLGGSLSGPAHSDESAERRMRENKLSSRVEGCTLGPGARVGLPRNILATEMEGREGGGRSCDGAQARSKGRLIGVEGEG